MNNLIIDGQIVFYGIGIVVGVVFQNDTKNNYL